MYVCMYVCMYACMHACMQGCVLAPTLFSMMFSAMLTHVFRDSYQEVTSDIQQMESCSTYADSPRCYQSQGECAEGLFLC